MIPVHASDGTRVPLSGENGRPGGIDLIERAAEKGGLALRRLDPHLPRWDLPGRGVLSFEPGGQIEVSTHPHARVADVVRVLDEVLRPVHVAAEELGIRLIHRGVDPAGRGETPLFIETARYQKQRAHYDSIGPWGRRMMCESAAIHVNLDLGARPVRRWRAAQRAAHVLTALFANAPGTLDGDEMRSVRAGIWRRLDPSRTGVLLEGPDPVEDYLYFALAARDFLGPDAGAETRPFRASWSAGASQADWQAHLTTVFPDVRPRGYLEVRSIDAIRPAWYAAPLTLMVGLLYDPQALSQALELLPPPDPERLVRAGRLGLTDPEIRGQALDLAAIALQGARSLGEGIVDADSIDRTEAFLDRFARMGADPGSEPEPELGPDAAFLP